MKRGWHGLVASAALAAAVFLAWHHPLWPGLALAVLVVWVATVFRYPGAWLFVVPAVLPGMSFAPWTGWIVFEEFDLVLLGVVVAGHARMMGAAAPESRSPDRAVAWLAGSLAMLAVLGLWRGFQDAGGLWFGWFQSHSDPLNALRVAKPVLFALLLAPLLGEQLRGSGAAALHRLALGMLAGLAVVALAALWERAAYPGVWDFTRRYRTTALFWEMHVGGAAIDAYLALATPFVVWSLWAARTPLRWGGAAVLALITGYACLTTFSRGLYAAVVVSLAVLGVLAWSGRARPSASLPARPARRLGDALLGIATLALLGVVFDQHGVGPGLGVSAAVVGAVAVLRRLQPGGWRTPASLALALAFALEVLVVFGPGSFMLNRLAASEQDSDNRWAHWRQGLALLSTPGEWLWGIGLGRFPARYAATGPEAEFSGAVQWLDTEPGRSSVRLSGPQSRADRGGLYGLSQRVASQTRYRLEFNVRGEPGTHVYARVCEAHLLYESRCQTGLLRLGQSGSEWRRQTLVLRGRSLSAPDRFPPRQAVFSLSVSSPGGVAEVDDLVLIGADRMSLLRNGDFGQGLAFWLPSATQFFVPWHIDSLPLEILIERGFVALVVMGALLALALTRLLAASRREPLRMVLLASLTGWLWVGVISSVLDVPRVALLACLILTCGLIPVRPAGDSG